MLNLPFFVHSHFVNDVHLLSAYTGFANVTMYVTDHDIVLTHDIIVEYKTTGKVSSVIKV